MKMITLANSFHKTTYAIRSSERTAHDAWEQLVLRANEDSERGHKARRVIRCVRRALCGAKGCKCGVVRMPDNVKAYGDGGMSCILAPHS